MKGHPFALGHIFLLISYYYLSSTYVFCLFIFCPPTQPYWIMCLLNLFLPILILSNIYQFLLHRFSPFTKLKHQNSSRNIVWNSKISSKNLRDRKGKKPKKTLDTTRAIQGEGGGRGGCGGREGWRSIDSRAGRGRGWGGVTSRGRGAMCRGRPFRFTRFWVHIWITMRISTF